MEGPPSYPGIDLHDYQTGLLQQQCSIGQEESGTVVQNEKMQQASHENEGHEDTVVNKNEDATVGHQKPGKYFYYDTPHSEETGIWIPVSVPPMSGSGHEGWDRGLSLNGGYLPDGDMGWDQFFGENRELTMWDVVIEMLVAARGKMSAITSGNVHRYGISWVSSHLLKQAWKEMAQTLTEANFSNIKEILEAEPPRWLLDSSASSCMLCNVCFQPIIALDTTVDSVGEYSVTVAPEEGVYCPQSSTRVTLSGSVVCCVRLESVQSYLMDQVSRAAQLPTQDLTDLSTLRS